MSKYFFVCVFYFFLSFHETKSQDPIKVDSIKNLLIGANQEDSIDYLLQIGVQFFDQEDYVESLDYFFSCLRLSERISYETGSADAENSIGRVYYNLDNFKMALEYYNRALISYRNLDDNESEGGVLNNLALVYYELDSIDQATDFYTQALEIKKAFNDTLNIGAISHNLGLVYMQKGDFKKAIQNLHTSRDVFKQLGFDSYVANATNNLGRAHYRDKKYRSALRFLEEALSQAQSIGSAFIIMDNYQYQSDCYAKMQNFQKALTFSNLHHNMRDSLLNIDKKKEIAEIQAKYENEIEEQENMLLKKELEANASTIKLQYFVVIGTLIITLLVATLALIYYRSNLIKKKANQLLKAQKEEIESTNQVLSKLNNEITNQNIEIINSKKKLEELNGIKDKLFSIISHELRSPLDTLKGTLTLLQAGALSAKELNHISKELTDNINTTSIFLDNLLNWAKSQMHGIQGKPESVYVRKCAKESIELLRPMADKKKIKINNNINKTAEAFVDLAMMSLIFKNLISNAIKFSLSKGTITISSEEIDNLQTISITDEGVGMSVERIRMLFQLQSFSTKGTANEKGTGLGLYISKYFVEANGGHIWAESTEGTGSTFKFTIPIKSA